jgi:hypothetical protein
MDGFWPRYCLEDLTWYTHEVNFAGFPMVCFCDIPLSRISEHVDFYGEFGIGVTKEWGLSNKLNPVSYIVGSSHYGNAINNLYKHVDYDGDSEYYKGSNKDLNHILAHLKPLEGKMQIAGNLIDKEFYQENEWRYFPKNKDVSPWISKNDFEKQETLDASNLKAKELCSLKISPNDIKYIFVKKDSDIPDMIDFIQTKLDKYTGVELKILMSRVISLESISSDL